MNKKVLVILGHPDTNSLCGTLFDAYIDGSRKANSEVKTIRLGELDFDPIIRKGFRQDQSLEPDLVQAQDLISWADHLVFIYPNWWGSMPALMKGFFDRIFIPGFAYRYRQDSVLWDKLLSGKTAHLMVTMDTPSWYYRWVYGRLGHKQMKKNILGFCGIKVVKISEFTPVIYSNDKKRVEWISSAQQLGENAG